MSEYTMPASNDINKQDSFHLLPVQGIYTIATHIGMVYLIHIEKAKMTFFTLEQCCIPINYVYSAQMWIEI